MAEDQDEAQREGQSEARLEGQSEAQPEGQGEAQPEGQSEAQPAPDERELLQQLEAELRKLKVVDILTQTVYTVSSLGWRRLGAGEEQSLEEARLAIDSLRALLPVLERALPAEAMRDFNQVVANMQLAYAKASAESSPGAEG